MEKAAKVTWIFRERNRDHEENGYHPGDVLRVEFPASFVIDIVGGDRQF